MICTILKTKRVMIKCNVTVCGIINRDATTRTNKEGKPFLRFLSR